MLWQKPMNTTIQKIWTTGHFVAGTHSQSSSLQIISWLCMQNIFQNSYTGNTQIALDSFCLNRKHCRMVTAEQISILTKHDNAWIIKTTFGTSDQISYVLESRGKNALHSFNITKMPCCKKGPL